MAGRLRAVAVVLVVAAAGAFLGSAFAQWRSRPETPTDSARVAALGRVVRVEVLNAAGIEDLARGATDRLRSAGFDVVYFGNADAFDRDSSVVLDRVHRLDGARAVADVLGIRNVRSQPDSNLYLDVSVLLGREWGATAGAVPGAAGTERPWYDPRGWVGR